MVRQARSEATRRRIIDSAIDLINEIGYPAAGLADIIERADLTKGALYYHFDSKEALATTIIEEGANKVLESFRAAGRSSSPAMENIVHGLFVVTDVLGNDRVAQAAGRLLRTFGGFNPAAKKTYAVLLDEMTMLTTSAIAEGDLRSELDPAEASSAIIGFAARCRIAVQCLDRRQGSPRTIRPHLGPVVACTDLRGFAGLLPRVPGPAVAARRRPRRRTPRRHPR